jgi:hypothetical protein
VEVVVEELIQQVPVEMVVLEVAAVVRLEPHPVVRD